MNARSSSRTRRRHAVTLLEDLESRMLLSTAHHTPTKHKAATNTSAISTLAVASSSSLSPAQIEQAYGINAISFDGVSGTGAGQTIAIVDAYNDPTIAADLHTFDLAYGLSDPTLTVINENGGATLPRTDPAGRGNSWALETSLDVEWAHAIAPGANIVLVEASSDSTADLMKAVDAARSYAGVSVVSISWGMTESANETSLDSHFTTPAGHTGVTFVAASGDDGAYGSGTRTTSVDYPAASPNVLAVGGTSLTVDSNGNYISETAWGDGARSAVDGGSGGGISKYESQPSYQSGVVTQSTTKRTVPDVAMVADPNTGVSIVDSYDDPSSPWIQIGGTSLAAPIWAAIIAIADQGRALAGESTLTSAQTLAAIYSAPSADFHDITSGSNGYSATTGYDLVTGRGSPVANLLVSYLVNPSSSTTTTTTTTPTIASLIVSPSSATVGTPLTLTAVGVADSNGTVTTIYFYRESNNTTGLQTSSDTLLGTGTQNGSNWTLTLNTSSLAAGNYTYYAVAENSAGQYSAASSATSTLTAQTTVSSDIPLNDNLANATLLSGTSISATGSTTGATKESGEPNHAGNRGGHSVWFTWTALTSGFVTINTHGSSFDTLLAVYTGSTVASLTLVAANDDDRANRTLTSSVTFYATAGTTYDIAIDGYNGASGNYTLNLQTISVPQYPTSPRPAPHHHG